MATIHYKLPLDETVDKDIINWIESLPRMKKGDIVRHAIRCYMLTLEEGEFIKFPNATASVSNVATESKQVDNPDDKEDEKPAKKKPKMNKDALKGKV